MAPQSHLRKLALSNAPIDIPLDATHYATCYVAGPMRGYEEYNFPAFNQAASALREAGWRVHNPAENPPLEGTDESGSHPLKKYMKLDLPMICDSDAVFFLEGWQDSEGAMLEHMVSQALDIPCYRYLDAGRMTIIALDNDTATIGLDHSELEGILDNPFEPRPGTGYLTAQEQLDREIRAEAMSEAQMSKLDAFVEALRGPGKQDVAQITHAYAGAEDEIEAMRTFETGATRNNDASQPDYEGFLSPLVIQSFGQYMNRNRLQADGTIRDSDNWQKGIPKDAYMKSGFRHFFDWWADHRQTGVSRDMDIETAINGLLFNAMGYLHEHLRARQEKYGA